MVFVIHWHESALDIHVLPILIPPPTSLSTWSLWVFPVHQAWALVSCIEPGLVICFILDNIHVSMWFSWNIPPSPSPNSLNLCVCSGLWRTLRELITGWICLSPFDSPFYPPGHLCLLPPSSLLCVTLWTSLRGPDCGEHIGKWSLASLLSPLLIPPSAPPGHLTPSPLFSSPCNSVYLSRCPSLWRNFIINLDGLSSVLYRWRSLEATVRIRLKTRGRRLKPKSWEYQRTPKSREH